MKQLVAMCTIFAAVALCVDPARAAEPAPVAAVKPVPVKTEPAPVAAVKPVPVKTEPAPAAAVKPVAVKPAPAPAAAVKPVAVKPEPAPAVAVKPVAVKPEPAPVVAVKPAPAVAVKPVVADPQRVQVPPENKNPVPLSVRYKDKIDWHMVSIEALVVEVDEERSRQLGLSYGVSTLDPLGGNGSGVLDGADVSLGPKSLGMVPVAQLQESAQGTTGVGFAGRMPGLGISLVGMNVDSGVVAAQLRALLDRGEAVIRTRPIGVALNNTKVTIETVDEIPYVDVDQKGKLGIQKKAAGIKMDVTPTIVPDFPGAVTLDISNIEISSASSFITLQNVNRPVITVSKTHTKVTLREGETFIIGGLKTRRKMTEEEKVPILGRIPLLKWLFTSRREVERNMDVLFFITPNILAPGENFLLPYDFKHKQPLGLEAKTKADGQ